MARYIAVSSALQFLLNSINRKDEITMTETKRNAFMCTTPCSQEFSESGTGGDFHLHLFCCLINLAVLVFCGSESLMSLL